MYLTVGTIGDGSGGPRTKDHQNRPQWSPTRTVPVVRTH